MWDRLRYFVNPFDARFEDLRGPSWPLVVLRDLSAGLIVAMVAIPLAMGFALASGLRPEQGIVGGAVAGLVGALFGGSKYQVYGPTAAFIPVIAGFMAAHATPEDPYAGHGLLVVASILAGVVLVAMGLTGWGKLVRVVPHSIVVGFTIGIAVTIALSQIGEVFGYTSDVKGGLFTKLSALWEHRGEFNGFAVLLALVTFLATRELLRISPYVPGPLIAIGIGSLLVGATDGASVALISTKYGTIPTNFWVLTPPAVGGLSWPNVFDVTYMAVAIVFVSAVESLLCSRMADRMAENRGTPFNPDKELWGQGWVQLIVPFLNGFPHTGALARTATNIKLGARTPLAGIFKGILKLVLAFCLARYLEQVPMACLGGVLLWVAVNMVKPAEIKQVLAHSRFHAAVMVYTALAVMVTDFLTGVLTALALYGVLFRFFDKPGVRRHEKGHQAGSAADPAGSTSRQPALSPELAPSGPIYDMPR